MARRYFTIMHFVQNINIDLLDAYFQQAKIPFPENLKILEDDTKPNASGIDKYINSLDAEQQYQISYDFMEINEMAYEGGILSILEFAETQGVHLQEEINKQDGHTNQAMYGFINYKEIFEGASQVAYFDNLSTKIVKHNLLKKLPTEVSTNEIKTKLENILKKYFKQKDGRGKNCEINIIKYKDRIFYHAMPQNFSQFIFDYDEHNKLRRSVVSPIFEIIYIYYPTEGKLELSVKLGNKRRNELVTIFNETVLKDDRPLKDGQQTYDFNRLLSPEFNMPMKPEDDISWLYLKQLRLSYRYTSTKRITLEIDDKETKGAEALHAMIKELGLNTEQLNVTQATIKMKFQGAGNKGSVTAVITYPDKCNLTDKPTHQKAKEYIKYWGLELNNDQ